MATAISVRIPAGKLGTVRVDRTVDVYQTTENTSDEHFNTTPSQTCIPTVALHRQLTKTTLNTNSIPPITSIDYDEEHQPDVEHHAYFPITKWTEKTNGNNNNNNEDEQTSDIAVIYSLVRHASPPRTSSPKIIVPPSATNLNSSSRPLLAKTYVLEAPLTPVVTHTSKQAQIKNLSSTRSTHSSILTSTSAPAASQTHLTPHLTPPIPLSGRIQTSTSFTSHDRPSIPSVAIKPRPYSFRSTLTSSNERSKTGTNNLASTTNNSQSIRSRRSFRTAPRNAIERQISNLTGRVSQLHDSLLARLSDFTSNTNHRQRNRSLTSLHSQSVNPPNVNMNENDLRLTQNPSSTRQQRRSVKPRPKSETYDDHHRVNAGK